MPEYSETDLAELIREANERAHPGRMERLRFLLSFQDDDFAPVPVLAYEYFEEARLCWFVGAFVASIVMTQLAFEELIRSQYRVAKGVGGKLDHGKKVDDAGFADLVRQARADASLTPSESEDLDRLRKLYRNPYVHPKDTSKSKTVKNDFVQQAMKIQAPQLGQGDVSEEAKDAIGLLQRMFFPLARRLWGVDSSGT